MGDLGVHSSFLGAIIRVTGKMNCDSVHMKLVDRASVIYNIFNQFLPKVIFLRVVQGVDNIALLIVRKYDFWKSLCIYILRP